MRRSIPALLLTGLLTALALWDLRQVDELSTQLCALTDLAVHCCEKGDMGSAQKAADSALAIWEERELYRAVFLRHNEMEETAAALLALSSALRAGETADALAAAAAANHHLKSLRDMEHCCLGSIF